MNIQLDQQKYAKAIVNLWILAIGAIVIATALFSVNLYLHHEISLKRIAFAVFLFGLFVFYGFQLSFYRKLKGKNVITYEDGVLNDYSKPFNKARNLDISTVFAVDFWGKIRDVNQCRIVLKTVNKSPNALWNQLRGQHIYLTDYVIDTGDFQRLVEALKRDLK